MAATSTRHATSAAERELVPACPACRSLMVVRAQWSGGRVHGLYWGCKRAPGCEGTRRIKSADSIRPTAHDASAQALYDWESTRERRPAPYRSAAVAAPPATGLRALLGKVLSRESEASIEVADANPVDGDAVGHFDSLVEHGFVIIEDRALPSARAHIDYLIVGPSGVHVVDRKSWAGQVLTTADSVFVDGRQRIGATDRVSAAAEALDQTLDYELKPLGITTRPAVLFDRATNRSFEGQLGKVVVGGTRALPKLIRGRGEPVLGPETILRLAVAADRLLE